MIFYSFKLYFLQYYKVLKDIVDKVRRSFCISSLPLMRSARQPPASKTNRSARPGPAKVQTENRILQKNSLRIQTIRDVSYLVGLVTNMEKGKLKLLLTNLVS
jgi:hypothetical protein